MSSARTGAVETVIGAFVPLSPVVAFLIVIAAAGRATVMRQRARPAEHREKGREPTGAGRRR
jgi:hypothetical protein